jgi:hypothetical protein
MRPNVGSFGAVYLCRKTNTEERKAVKVFFFGDEKEFVSSYILFRGLQQEQSKEADIKVGMMKEWDCPYICRDGLHGKRCASNGSFLLHF